MPELTKVLMLEDLGRHPHINLNLGPYLEMIDSVQSQAGTGGEVTLAEGENRRTEKRRLSVAAKERGLRLTWRRPTEEQQLRFVLRAQAAAVVQEPAALAEPRRSGRPRKNR